MTKPVIGKVERNIANDLAHVCYEREKLYAAAMEDLIDGDDDTTKAQRIINDLRTGNVTEFAIQEKIVRGALSEAETEAMRLAASDKGSLKS